MAFMPQNAPLVVLMFLGACFALALTAIVIVYGCVSGKRPLIKYALAVALAGAGVYGGLLLVASLGSREKVLELGEQKYFCEVDCHEAYSVVDVATNKTVGIPGSEKPAQGTFYVVKIKVWFDERTISSHRARNMPLTPNPRTVVVVDERGKEYGLSAAGQEALEQARGKSIPFTQLLRPGESYTTSVVFDLPSNVRNARLYITTQPWLTRWLIGHENSPFHKKIFFRLAPQRKSAAVRSVAWISP